MVHVRLADGSGFEVNTTLEELTDVFQRVLTSKQLIEIKNTAGKRWALNPLQIVYIEGMTRDDRRRSWLQRMSKMGSAKRESFEGERQEALGSGA